jgi:hypothetical protein
VKLVQQVVDVVLHGRYFYVEPHRDGLVRQVLADQLHDLAFPARLASHQWLWAFGLAFGGAFAHYCLTNALRVADALRSAP